MKVSVSVSLRITILLAIAIVAVSVLVGCNKKAQQPDIIRKDYKYQKANWEFNFHLENIGNSDKISNLVNKLIYDSRDFDEYVSKMEHSVLKDSSDPDVDNTRGSYLSAKYSIIYADEKYVVISYFYEEYYGYAAHPNHKQNCFFIDIPEERLLLINDLINPIPEKTLLDLIIKSYENDGGLDADNIMRDTIWPPDLITVGYENHSLIYLVWNTYTLLPHAYGPVEVTGSEISQHLTDKGKEIMKRLAATAPQKPAEEKPAADGAETATAQAAETPEGDDGSVDFGKLTLKGDVYYLNNAPFTGTARKVLDDGDAQEKYEMKDGKFHGKFTGDYPNSSVTGYYKDGKKHGEWKASGYSEGTYFEIHNYKDGKKHGEWKYIKEVFGDEEGKPYKEMIGGEGEGKYQLYKTETWENDKLIKEWEKEDGEAKNASKQPIRIADQSVLSKYTSYHDWGTSEEFSSDVIIADVAVKDFRMYSIYDGKLSSEYQQLDKFTPEKPIAVSRESMWTAAFSYLDDKNERRFFSFKYDDKPYLEELINPQFRD